MRHDAQQSRQHAKSEQIRRSRGWLTPQELKEQADAEERRRLASQGPALFEEQ